MTAHQAYSNQELQLLKCSTDRPMN